MSDQASPQNPAFPGDAILNRLFLTPEQKADWAEGKRIMKDFFATQTTNDSNYNFFKRRNARWREVLLMAKGSQDIKDWLDYMNITDADKAYLRIDTTPSRVAPMFMSTLVESMAKTKVYPCVKAYDDGSMDEKEKRLWEAMYRMHEVETIDNLQQASGLQLEPTDAFVPDDELSAKVYFEMQDKLPKEIRFEKLLQTLMTEIKFQTILNRKTLYDMGAINFGALKIEKIGPKKYTIRVCTSTNMLYNFFVNDNGDCQITMIGEWVSIKVKDFRPKFGQSKENPKGLTEKEIFELAKSSGHQSLGKFVYDWNDSYNYDIAPFGFTRPYDDSNILCIDAEVDFTEDRYYVEKVNKRGITEIEQKKTIPYQNKKSDGSIQYQPVPENVEIKKRPQQSWMRGVYAPYGDKMLYWGQPDLIISEFTNYFKPLSSYVINIPNNDGEYVPSLLERAMDCFRDYQLIKLKRRQIIALIEPDGFTIDVETARNLDLGTGNQMGWEEVLRIKNQTGVQLYSSAGIDPLQRENAPIAAGVQTTNISKVIELTNVMAGIMVEIRQLLGVPAYRDGSDVGDRTANALAENQNTNSFNVTDYVAVANNELWSEAFYRYCLLNWNDIVRDEPESKEDIFNFRFNVEVEIKSTEYERQRLEQDIQRFSAVPDAEGNPSLTPKDSMMLREIGAEDYKMANWYLTHTYETNRKRVIQEKRQNEQQNLQEQAAVSKQGALQDLAIQHQKLKADKEMVEYKALQDMKVAIVSGSFAIAAKGETAQMPEWLPPILQQLVPNIQIPIAQENKEMAQEIAAAADQEQAAASQQQQAPPQQQGGQPMPQGPSPQMIQQ